MVNDRGFSGAIKFIEKSLGSRSDAFETYLVGYRSLSVEVKDQELDFLEVAEERGAALRVIKDEKLGFSFSSTLAEQDLERMVENALFSSTPIPQDPCYTFAEPPESLPEVRGLLDPEIAAVSRERKVELARELEAGARAADPRVKIVRKASYNERSFRVRLANSLGLDLSQEGTVATAYVMAVAEEGNEGEVGHDYALKRSFAELDPSGIGKEAGLRAAARLHGRIIKSGLMPVVLTREAATGLLGVLCASLFYSNVAKKRSFFMDRVGQKVAAEGFNLVDNSLLESGPASFRFDGEGVPSRTNVLIEDGLLRGYLYDLYWGKRGKTSSTASGRRSLAGPVRVGTSNLILGPGEMGFDELVSQMRDGVVVDDLMGLHTANPVTGEFSLGASGFRVEQGEVTHPVKGIALAGTIPGLLGSIEAIGSDLKFFGSLGAPSLLVSGLTVAGT